jgi:peptidoglycan/xylan/chitin deacetylase (PgdA/CDA1 family)
LLTKRWVAAAKTLRAEERAAAVRALAGALEAPPGDNAFDDLHVTWDEVRTMAANGIAIGAHTCNHSILSQVSQEEARRQICGSRAAIEAAIGRKVTSFAYPNGHLSDYDEHHIAILRDAGFEAAFTLTPGPCWPREVRSNPFEIRRIIVTTKDDIPRFSAKVIGLGRAWDNI